MLTSSIKKLIKTALIAISAVFCMTACDALLPNFNSGSQSSPKHSYLTLSQDKVEVKLGVTIKINVHAYDEKDVEREISDLLFLDGPSLEGEIECSYGQDSFAYFTPLIVGYYTINMRAIFADGTGTDPCILTINAIMSDNRYELVATQTSQITAKIYENVPMELSVVNRDTRKKINLFNNYDVRWEMTSGNCGVDYFIPKDKSVGYYYFKMDSRGTAVIRFLAISIYDSSYVFEKTFTITASEPGYSFQSNFQQLLINRDCTISFNVANEKTGIPPALNLLQIVSDDDEIVPSYNGLIDGGEFGECVYHFTPTKAGSTYLRVNITTNDGYIVYTLVQVGVIDPYDFYNTCLGIDLPEYLHIGERYQIDIYPKYVINDKPVAIKSVNYETGKFESEKYVAVDMIVNTNSINLFFTIKETQYQGRVVFYIEIVSVDNVKKDQWFEFEVME